MFSFNLTLFRFQLFAAISISALTLRQVFFPVPFSPAASLILVSHHTCCYFRGYHETNNQQNHNANGSLLMSKTNENQIVNITV